MRKTLAIEIVRAACLQNETAPEKLLHMIDTKNGLEGAKKDPKKRSETRPKHF